MTDTLPIPCSHADGQRGSALVVALVFLLLLTMLGISAMQGSNMQERMAGNLRDRNMAFQAAEAALRGGETWLMTLANQQAADLNPQIPDPAAWDGAAPVLSPPVPITAPPVALAALDVDQLAGDPVFYIGPPSLRRIGIQLPPDFRRIYPITARGEGGSDVAVVVLQSSFEPPQ